MGISGSLRCYLILTQILPAKKKNIEYFFSKIQ